MQLNPVASTILVIAFLMGGVFSLGCLFFIAFLLKKVYMLAEAGQKRVEPVLDKTEKLLTTATEKVEEIGGKTGAILGETEATTEAVRTRVERTATVVQQTVAKPVVGVNALAAGVQQGARTFLRLQGWRKEEKPVDVVQNDGNLAANGSVSNHIGQSNQIGQASSAAGSEIITAIPTETPVAIAVGNAGAAGTKTI